MVKIRVPLISFSVGFCCALGLSFHMRSVDAVAAQVNDSRRGIDDGGGLVALKGSPVDIEIEGAVPSFISLERTLIFKRYVLENGTQHLDGFDCRECTFKNVALQYGGGAYHLENAKFSGTTSISLTGAAANTVAFLRFLQSIGRGIPGVSFPTDSQLLKRRSLKSRCKKWTLPLRI